MSINAYSRKYSPYITLHIIKIIHIKQLINITVEGRPACNLFSPHEN